MISFTQFLRPDGRRRESSIERPANIEKMAQELSLVGCRFEIEELMTGYVHMSVECQGLDEPLTNELCKNGPQVPDAVDRMIQIAHVKKFPERYAP